MFQLIQDDTLYTELIERINSIDTIDEIDQALAETTTLDEGIDTDTDYELDYANTRTALLVQRRKEIENV